MKKIIFLISVLLVAAVGWSGYFLADVFLTDSSAAAGYQLFTIQAGEGVNQISQNLSAAGLINSRFNFETYLWLLRREGRIQAGQYQLQPSLSLRQLTNLITYGRGSNEKRLTIIEGWNNRQVGEYLAANLFSGSTAAVSQEQFLTDWSAAVKQNYDFDFLADKPANVDVEGYLFPDTYNFYLAAKPQAAVERMLGVFADKISRPEIQELLSQQDKSLHEIVTLASIVEREVNREQDRRLVADIFWRRLAIGMPLQADSTVNYLTDKKTPAISAEDKNIDSPYNTYKYRGLPPGPICNPGLAAIKAALQPISNDYWYFLTTPAGDVIYSKTLDQHNLAKAKYLK